MAILLSTVIDELFRYRASFPLATKSFRKWKHNADLCPAVEDKLNYVLDCFIKYHSVAYDVQGIHDRGTDILLRLFEGEQPEHTERRYISIQIKSYDDLKKSDYLKNLRAQCYEAQQEFGERLDYYFILLCTDAEEHQGKIREIKKAFGASEDVTVIDPTYMVFFLNLTPFRIRVFVDALLRDDDIVHQKARNCFLGMTPTEAAIYLTCAFQRAATSDPIDLSKIAKNEFVTSIYERTPDIDRDEVYSLELGVADEVEIDDEEDSIKKKQKDRKRNIFERFAEDIDRLVGDYFVPADEFSESVYLDSWALPVQAVLLEVMVRYEYEGTELLNYAYDILGISEQIEAIKEHLVLDE